MVPQFLGLSQCPEETETSLERSSCHTKGGEKHWDISHLEDKAELELSHFMEREY